MKKVHSVIIGAGFSGVCIAIGLKKAGIDDFIICEKADDVGGTWRDNNYPGVACDVPSHLYSYSFEPNPDWSKWYATGPEIHEYIRHCTRKYSIDSHIQFNSAVTDMKWQPIKQNWLLKTANSEIEARFVISAMGGLHVPNTPDFKGLSDFTKPVFHTSRWRHDLDFKDKRVAVIGTGATSVQCVPELAKDVAQLYVFQRSPVWVGPKNDPVYTEQEKQQFKDNPLQLKKHRWDLWRNWETTGSEIVTQGSDINKLSEQRARDLITRSVKNPDLAKKLTPNYNITCKRPTFSNEYYLCFEKDNVELVTDTIRKFNKQGIELETQGSTRNIEVDIVVMATGFKPYDITSEVNVVGLSGESLDKVWKEKISSYKSIMVSDLPNLFLMLGPNSGGLTSTLQMMEQETRYITQAISYMQENDISYVHPKQEKVDEFCEYVQQATAKTTHNKGCSSWWTGKQGYNHSVWPESSITYKMMLKEFEINDFDCVYRTSNKLEAAS